MEAVICCTPRPKRPGGGSNQGPAGPGRACHAWRAGGVHSMFRLRCDAVVPSTPRSVIRICAVRSRHTSTSPSTSPAHSPPRRRRRPAACSLSRSVNTTLPPLHVLLRACPSDWLLAGWSPSSSPPPSSALFHQHVSSLASSSSGCLSNLDPRPSTPSVSFGILVVVSSRGRSLTRVAASRPRTST